jgi:hypothetical protein
MLEALSNALAELAVAIAKLKYVHSVLQKIERDEFKRQRSQSEPKNGET